MQHHAAVWACNVLDLVCGVRQAGSLTQRMGLLQEQLRHGTGAGKSALAMPPSSGPASAALHHKLIKQ